MKVYSVVKISAIAILGLTMALMVPATASPRLSLQTQFFSKSVTLILWQNAVMVNSTGFCSASPFTAIIEGLNFTENLSGRDAGSTLVQFRGLPSTTSSYIIKPSQLSSQFISELWCSREPDTSPASILDLLSKVQVTMLASSGAWKVPSSGNYVLLSEAFYTSPPPPFLVAANETWTVTTIV